MLSFSVLCLLSAALSAQGYDVQQVRNTPWKDARATYYGTDDWSIHRGSCNFGYIWEDEPLGWDAAAITDFHPDYGTSCGSCYEVKCSNMWVQDNYGAKLDRTYSCYDENSSVVVRIVDTCPCVYPANPYSNKRWCCNDMQHFDVGIWTFEKLAETRWGVIGLKYRQVPCDYKPERSPRPLWNKTPGIKAPAGAVRPVRDWPELVKNEKGKTVVFEDSVWGGWKDVSWGNTWVQSPADSKANGRRSGTGLCAKIPANGALAFKGWDGVFQGHRRLDFWVYVGVAGWEGTAAQIPDIRISIRGNKGGCSPRKIYDTKPNHFEPMCQYCSDYFWKWQLYLPQFGGEDTGKVIIDPNEFRGCGGNGVWDLNQIEFRNEWGADKWICLDSIELI